MHTELKIRIESTDELLEIIDTQNGTKNVAKGFHNEDFLHLPAIKYSSRMIDMFSDRQKSLKSRIVS